MPAPLAKGIIISLSILTAIGIAVYENPQVKEWVEDQRRKFADFLSSFGDELDPQSRREAEAFAYEGRLPTQGREAAGAASAVARATGRESPDDAVSRRNRSSDGSPNAEEAAERRRLGREYLAKRNRDLLEMREKQKMRNSAVDEDTPLSEKTPHSPTFDNLVNKDGTLKTSEPRANEEDEDEDDTNEKSLELPSVPTEEPKPFSRKIPIQEAAEPSGVHTGFRYANPFGDEYEMSASYESRSATPKPPVPPKIALEDARNVRGLSIPPKEPSVRHTPVLDEGDDSLDLDYDEQLARALSLSLAESESAARLARQRQEEEQDAADYNAAVAASLAGTQRQQQQQQQPQSNDLINLAPDPPVSIPHQHTSSTDNDELYTLSPDFMQHRPLPGPIVGPLVIPPYDPVHEAAAALQPGAPSAVALLRSPTTATLSPEYERDAISFAASDSETDDFASVASRTQPPSMEASLIDFAELESVSDDDSDEGDGVMTPGSWTDVGSEVDSEEGVRGPESPLR